MRRTAGTAERLPERAEGGGVVVVAIDIAQQRQQTVERVPVVDAAIGLRDAVPRMFAQPRQIPLRVGHPDHRDSQGAAFHQPVERREDLLMSEITGHAEKHERIGRCHAVIIS